MAKIKTIIKLDKSIVDGVCLELKERLNGVKQAPLSKDKQKSILQAVINKVIEKNPKILTETVKELSNRELFDIIKNC